MAEDGARDGPRDAAADDGADGASAGAGAGDARTTRQRIADDLRDAVRTPSALADRFGLSTGAAIDHVRHVARSLDGTGEEVVVRPPRCRDCGFEAFDDPANVPSRCPDCRSESVEEPAFTVR